LIQLQVKEGIDAVIVDSVLAIRKGLTGSDPGQGASAVKTVEAARNVAAADISNVTGHPDIRIPLS
jgi:glycerophosphodiester phosphodiesterase